MFYKFKCKHDVLCVVLSSLDVDISSLSTIKLHYWCYKI